MERRETTNERREKDWQPDSEYLQRELGDILPPALAFIVEHQPQDPITQLALCLYQYRALNPLPTVSTSPDEDVQQTSVWPTHTPAHRTKIGDRTNKLTSHQQDTVSMVQRNNDGEPSSISIVQKSDEDEDDFIEDVDVSQRQSVHKDIAPVIDAIGDLFDDDDTR